MAPHDRYTLSPITSDDYPALANISILAFMRNPIHYMTYPPDVSHEEIVQYTKQYKAEAVAAHAQNKSYFLGETNSGI